MAIWGVGVGFRGVFLFYCVSLFEGGGYFRMFLFFYVGFRIFGRRSEVFFREGNLKFYK